MPKLGIGRHVVVAPSDAEAEAIARPAYAAWYANLTKLWRDFGACPSALRATSTRRGRAASRWRARPAGTSRRVREEL
jgi:alkanesulfonate monooxygenase SsuD/methylene tetrahydromethanopterin reductase-like flavin-dependent oxidoreductase (luciferase family)